MNNSPRLQQALEAAETVDPDNGRYPLIAAVYQAEDSAELIDEKHEGQPTTHRLEVIDRGKLDDAMAQVLRAIAKPHFHPYGRELAQEKASIIGTPRRFLDTVQATDLTQSYETPNIQAAYSAAKYSLAYARLLMQEGRDEEAVRFLHATEQLARRLAPESEALINLVIIRALLAKARDTVPEALREMGRTEEAEETHKRLLAILAPLKQDRAEGSAITQEQQVAIWRQTGVRVERDWPALGRDYSSREFLGRLGARNKMLFVGVAQCLAGYLGLWLLVAMLACVLISVRWRLALGSQSAPLLLLPSWTDICRYILCGTVLPIVLFVAWSQLPLSGMGFSPGYAGHRTAAAFLLLSAALLVLPAWLAARAFVRRCAELDLCPPPPLRKPFYLPLAGAVVLFIAAFCPSPTNPSAIDLGMRLNGWGTATLVLFFALVGVHALWGSRTHGRAMGTVSRSLVIVFASASLLLSAALQPLLHARERSLVRHWRGYMDEELMVPKDDLREIDELRDRTVATMAANPMPLQTD
jgi:tetratricopeptide (TPR) repeat protein